MKLFNNIYIKHAISIKKDKKILYPLCHWIGYISSLGIVLPHLVLKFAAALA